MSPASVQKNSGHHVDTFLADVPVTTQRKPYVEKPSDELKSPGTARANQAASAEQPFGTEKGGWAHQYRDQTVLQQHCAFFDTDSDGVIWPLDTYRGFYALGYGFILSLVALVVIHANFSYPTVQGFLPDPCFRIYIARIHKDKHGSDSGTYDNEGRFIPQKFEDIFAKYASGDKQGITGKEIIRYIQGQAVIMDPIGWGAAAFEWLATWILLWPEDGRMKKEDIRRIYDGSLFYDMAARRNKKIN
ncbi:hypothetical protein PVAG01_02904 [Phlyctema vagabunda]|uniref:Caleosin n=1 Tax=Phlyctema vagabunda TaxID=108571 RepID=A0ABR4PSE2_9HELO